MPFCTDRYNFAHRSTMSKAERTRQFIIEKTAVVFNKKGYAGTSLSDLTEATGLTKGALYGNFKNKDEIALAVFEYNTRLLKDGLLVKVNPEQDAIQQLLCVTQFFNDNYQKLALHGGCPILNTSVEADDNHPLLKKKVNQVINRWRKSIEAIIEAGIKKGEINKKTSAVSFATVMLSLLEGSIMLSKISGNSAYLTEAVTAMEKMIVALRN